MPDHKHGHPTLHARRIQESLTSRAAKFLCSLLLSLLLVATVIVFVLWLSLRPHRPRFHLSSFSAPGLTSGHLDFLSFNVSARNPNREIGIYYDAVSASVFYGSAVVGSSPALFPLYQPPKNTTAVSGNISGEEISAGAVAQRAAGRVGLRLVLGSTIRFRLSRWDSHRHAMHATCYVELGDDGQALEHYIGRKCPIYFG